MQNIMVVLKSREKRLNSLEANAAKGFKITNYSSDAVKNLSRVSLKTLAAEREQRYQCNC